MATEPTFEEPMPSLDHELEQILTELRDWTAAVVGHAAYGVFDNSVHDTDVQRAKLGLKALIAEREREAVRRELEALSDFTDDPDFGNLPLQRHIANRLAALDKED